MFQGGSFGSSDWQLWASNLVRSQSEMKAKRKPVIRCQFQPATRVVWFLVQAYQADRLNIRFQRMRFVWEGRPMQKQAKTGAGPQSRHILA